jgi:hypothetical protein
VLTRSLLYDYAAGHAGPVAPFPGHEPSPGSAEFVKGPTPPGGAAAAEGEGEAGEDWQQEQHRLAAEAGTDMHIGEYRAPKLLVPLSVYRLSTLPEC